MLSVMIEIPEFNWSGDKKKIEIRDPEVIRIVFHLASLMRTDFTTAVMRVLTTSTDRVIAEERLTRERLAAPFGGISTTVPTTPPPPPLQHQTPELPSVVNEVPAPSKPKRSGADLI